MIADALIWIAAPVALFIGTISAASVFKDVYIDKRELKCAYVGNEHLGFGKTVINEYIEAFGVGGFTTAYLRPDRQSVSIGNEVDLGREATF